jgi:hypothetical protein
MRQLNPEPDACVSSEASVSPTTVKTLACTRRCESLRVPNDRRACHGAGSGRDRTDRDTTTAGDCGSDVGFKAETKPRVVAYWTSVDPDLGARVAAGLGLSQDTGGNGAPTGRSGRAAADLTDLAPPTQPVRLRGPRTPVPRKRRGPKSDPVLRLDQSARAFPAGPRRISLLVRGAWPS